MKLKFSEIVHLEKKELWQKLAQLRKDLFDSRMKLKMQRLNNPLSIRSIRRDMARIQTVLSLKKKTNKDQKGEKQ